MVSLMPSFKFPLSIAIQVVITIQKKLTFLVERRSANIFIAPNTVLRCMVHNTPPCAICTGTDTFIAKVDGTFLTKSIFSSHTITNTLFVRSENSCAWCAQSNASVHVVFQVFSNDLPNFLIAYATTVH